MGTIKIIFTLLFGIVLSSAILITGVNAQSSSTWKTRVGNPPIGAGCWPTTGGVTQGPQGASSHQRIFAGSGDESIDIGNVIGTPIFANIDGSASVSHCANCTTGYGNSVTLLSTSPAGSSIIFGHMSSIAVSNNQQIKAGDLLGYMGETGYAFGSHLHAEFQGIPLAPPYVPQAITPRACDSPQECNPSYVSASDTSCIPGTTEEAEKSYWFVLHRQSLREELYFGIPGNFEDSGAPKRVFDVRVGLPGKKPTPLPQLHGKDYWLITAKKPANSDETRPYFLTLNIPYDSEFAGPEDYYECGPSGNEQCDWIVPGEFGLHGINGVTGRIDGTAPENTRWSSGCVRHYDDDITYLYNLLDPYSNEIRYYVQDN